MELKKNKTKCVFYIQIFPFRYQVSYLGRNPPRAIGKTPSQLVVESLWPGNR